MRRSLPFRLLLFALLLSVPVSAQHPFPLRERLEVERCCPRRRRRREGQRCRVARAGSCRDRALRRRPTASFTGARPRPTCRPISPTVPTHPSSRDRRTANGGSTRRPASNAGSRFPTTEAPCFGRRMAAFMLRDSVPRPVPPLFAFYESSRALNPLAVLVDVEQVQLASGGSLHLSRLPPRGPRRRRRPPLSRHQVGDAGQVRAHRKGRHLGTVPRRVRLRDLVARWARRPPDRLGALRRWRGAPPSRRGAPANARRSRCRGSGAH